MSAQRPNMTCFELAAQTLQRYQQSPDYLQKLDYSEFLLVKLSIRFTIQQTQDQQQKIKYQQLFRIAQDQHKYRAQKKKDAERNKKEMQLLQQQPSGFNRFILHSIVRPFKSFFTQKQPQIHKHSQKKTNSVEITSQDSQYLLSAKQEESSTQKTHQKKEQVN